MTNNDKVDPSASSKDQQKNAAIYLIVIVFMVACLCATTNFFVYGLPKITLPPGEPTPNSPNITLLIISGAVVAALSGVLADIVTSYLSIWIDSLSHNSKLIVGITVVIAFVATIILGAFLSVVLY